MHSDNKSMNECQNFSCDVNMEQHPNIAKQIEIYKSEITELTKKISELIEENNQKNILLLQQQKHIKSLEIKIFSDSVPPERMEKPQVKAVAKPQVKAVAMMNNALKMIISNFLQKSILFCGKFIKNESLQRKLRKLSSNPYAYFADSKYTFLRPFCELFDD